MLPWIFLALFAIAHALELWENVHYHRSVDLSKSYVRELCLVEAKNTGDTPQDTYIFRVNDGIDAVPEVATVGGVLIDQRLALAVSEQEAGVYSVKFPFPVAPASSVEFEVFYAYTNTLVPLPEKIEMADRQMLLLKTNKLPYSDYRTSEYSLAFRGFSVGQELDLQPSTPVSPDLPHLSGHVDKDAQALTYGPQIVDVPPLSVSPMGLLYEHNKPVTRVVTLERSVWVPGSDVGVVQTEDYYELYNNGAQLKSGYSRVEWLKGRFDMVRDHHALSRLEFPLGDRDPLENYYFTDKVGKVSSVLQVPGHVVFQPRFPLFGGWKYNFTMGWTNGIANFVRRVDEDTYVAQFPLVSNLRDIYYDNVSVSVLLPENAEVIDVQSTVPSTSSVGRELSYLDVADGHVKVTLHFRNLQDSHSASTVLVKYRYTAQSFWKKVGTIAAWVFTALASYYALGLLDLSVN